MPCCKFPLAERQVPSGVYDTCPDVSCYIQGQLRKTDVRPRSAPALEPQGRARQVQASVPPPSGPNTGSNPGEGRVLKKKMRNFLRTSNISPLNLVELQHPPTHPPQGRDSGNDFRLFSVSFFEGRISYIRAVCNYPTRNAIFKSWITDNNNNNNVYICLSYERLFL